MLGNQIFEQEILMDLHILRSPEYENHILAVLVCVYLLSESQKQIRVETLNLVFYICIMFRYYLNLFIKIGQKVCTGTHKNL